MSRLGIPDKPSLTIESACGSGSVSFREAYANIAAGFYDCLIATGVEKVTHTGTEWTTTYFAYCSDFFYEGQAGASFPGLFASCLLYTSPSPRDQRGSRMPSSA